MTMLQDEPACFVVRQPTPDEIHSGISWEAARIKEKEWFEASEWRDIAPNRQGTKKVKAFLKYRLLEWIFEK